MSCSWQNEVQHSVSARHSLPGTVQLFVVAGDEVHALAEKRLASDRTKAIPRSGARRVERMVGPYSARSSGTTLDEQP